MRQTTVRSMSDRPRRSADAPGAAVFAAFFLGIASCMPGRLPAAEPDASAPASVPPQLAEEFRVKREAVFEFAKKPVVTRAGDMVTIAFATKGFCDATVAIEDADGRILRHLASGVLGDNAPPPFRKGSKEQVLVWDGKNDRGEYVDDKEKVSIRVSLGIKPRFERQFLWLPYRRITPHEQYTPNLPPAFAAVSEGVLVCDGNLYDHIRLFDREGNYLRTIYPFPSDRLDRLIGVPTRVYPQSGKKLPVKGGLYRSTFLTSGTTSNGGYLVQRGGRGATALAAAGTRVAAAMLYLNRLSTDGDTGGLPIAGPATHVPFKDVFIDGNAVPRSAAFSPDGRTLYLTGFFISAGVGAGHRPSFVQGVGRVDVEKGATMEVFAGSLAGKYGQGGSEQGRFRVPFAVETDAQGRVYVSDHYNDRVQIFDPSGKPIKSISVTGPTDLSVDRKSGEIYVFSWTVANAEDKYRTIQPRLTVFGPYDRCEKLKEYPVSFAAAEGQQWSGSTMGLCYRALVHFDARGEADPVVWAYNTPLRSAKVFRLDRQAGKLVLLRDFEEVLSREVSERLREQYTGAELWTRDWKTRMAVNPKTQEVFIVREGPGVWNRPLAYDPESGRLRCVTLPLDAEDIAFDMEGHAYIYVYCLSLIVRYVETAPGKWREVPFDYGEQRRFRGSGEGPDVLSALPLPGGSQHQQGGLWVSPKGYLIAAFLGTRGWTPQMYGGRAGKNYVRVWDRHGKTVYADAIQGVGYVDGIFIDKDDYIYLCSDDRRTGYFSSDTGTMIKARPNARVINRNAAIPPPVEPNRPYDTDGGWWEGAEWFYGGTGFTGKSGGPGCHCPHYRPAHDYFARTFVPETEHYTVALLDSNGNLILRIGQYGNVDDGVPLVPDPRLPKPRSLGGDEVGLFWPAFLATHTDRRLYIADPGNMRHLSVRLEYHAQERVFLRDVPDTASGKTGK
ncbi:MAG: hypothetical protein N3A38_11375 [Planctomycetota bacterium]|nr:hypothetical protein [Planctomycetota bacterium]